MMEAFGEALLQLMARHGIGRFYYEGPEGSLYLDAEREVQDHPEVFAEAAGIFLATHPLSDARAVFPRHVSAGEMIGWLKVGPWLRPVLAREDAILRAPRVEHGTSAGYGDRLF